MAYADRFRTLMLDGPRRPLSDDAFDELVVDTKTAFALRAAGISKVSSLRAQLEEHGSLRHLPGIGPKREEDIRAALELYEEAQLPLDDPVLRTAAVSVAAARAGSTLLTAAKLSADPEWKDGVQQFVREFLIPEVRLGDLGRKMTAEAEQVLRAATREGSAA